MMMIASGLHSMVPFRQAANEMLSNSRLVNENVWSNWGIEKKKHLQVESVKLILHPFPVMTMDHLIQHHD